MSPSTLLTRTLAILTVAALIAAIGWVTRFDEQVASASLEQYCEDAAIWAAEDARGVPFNQRTGQPDYRGIAAEQCPGMQPAGPAYRIAGAGTDSRQGILDSSTERQLARQ